MPVLRVASLAIVALWIGGLGALGLVRVPPEFLERFRQVSWAFGGGIYALLIVRALLGPRPRRLSMQMGLVAVMLAASVFPVSLTLMTMTVAAGLVVFWIEARD